MRPSEAFDYLNDLHSEALGAKLRWVALQASYEGLRKQLDDGVAIEIVGESAKNLLAETAIEREDDGSEETAPFAATMPPAPKLRADGQPRQKPGRKPKAHVAAPTSPLTPDLRAKLEATLSRGPMTLEALTRMSWAADVKDVEGLLCEDAETFLRWMDYGSKEGRVVWGLVEHFDRAVTMLTLQCEKAERGKFTAEALGCSVYQALGAWKRLDPEAT